MAIFGKYNLQHVSVINGEIKRCVWLPLHIIGTKLTGKILGEHHKTLGSVIDSHVRRTSGSLNFLTRHISSISCSLIQWLLSGCYMLGTVQSAQNRMVKKLEMILPSEFFSFFKYPLRKLGRYFISNVSFPNVMRNIFSFTDTLKLLYANMIFKFSNCIFLIQK